MKPIKVLSLFDGMSGTMLALKDLGIPVQEYYASEIDKYAEAESTANFPDIIRLGDVTKWKTWNIPWEEIDLLVGGFPCFPGGTLVQTDKGPVDIKDIRIGDKVLTHTGHYRAVLDTGSKYAPTRIISGMGHLPIECTDEHPFYSRKKDTINSLEVLNEAEWIDAQYLTADHYLAAVRAYHEDDIYSPRMSKPIEEMWYNCGVQKNIIPEVFSTTIRNKMRFLCGLFSSKCIMNAHGFESYSSTAKSDIIAVQQLVMDVYGKSAVITESVTSNTSTESGFCTIYTVYFRIDNTFDEHTHYEDEYAWVKGCQTNVGTGEFKQVYNLEVETDNTYVVHGMVVHNCQAWSVAGKQGGTTDPRGMLFHTLMDIWGHMKGLNPDLKFLFENVKMKEDFKDYISNHIGSEPFYMNSEQFTAQSRQRYYWCNWWVPAAQSYGPPLQSVLESGYVDRSKSYCIDASYYKGGDCNQYFNKSRRQLVFYHSPIDKNFLLQNGKNKVHYRKLTVKECCRLQGIPDTYIKVSSDTQAYKMIGNGFTIPVISYILSYGFNKPKGN